MPSSPTIRSLCPQDAQALHDIHKTCFPDAWSEEAFATLLKEPLNFGWIALQETTAVGFILAKYVIDEAEILTFAVQPAYQNQGIGAKLLDALLEYLQKNQVKSLFLEVSVLNEAAIHLYNKLGFTEITRRPNYFQHLTDPTAIVLRKVVDESSH